MVFDKELDENLKVCPRCQHHFPISSRERIHSLVETCTFEEIDAYLAQNARPGDLVVTVGSGDVYIQTKKLL
jgi:acetyl-CoA carboxylase beta subunit